jgi:phosphopantetheinyl transferase
VLSLEPHCGIDLENRKVNPRFMAIAQRFFAPNEYDYLMQLGTLDAWSVFLDFWTRKEACVKAWHIGLAHHLAEVSFKVHTLNPITAPACYEHVPLNVFCYAHSNWQLAVAIHSHHQPTKPQLITLDGLLT